MAKGTPPIELLKQLREVFKADADSFRRKEATAWTRLEKQAMAGQAAACEYTVKRIDDTLRDWG